MPDTQTRISIKVIPNAGRNEILGLQNDVWRIKVAAPPDKGKANKELISFLSGILGLKKDDLSILRGHTSHSKLIQVDWLLQAEVNQRLSSARKQS
jgi:uncharacterized protein